jgi:hypothetical protein
MIDLCSEVGFIRDSKVTQQGVWRGHTQLRHRSQRVTPIAGIQFRDRIRRGGRERDFLGWTEKLHLLALDNHDLPKAIGFVESYRRYAHPIR